MALQSKHTVISELWLLDRDPLCLLKDPVLLNQPHCPGLLVVALLCLGKVELPTTLLVSTTGRRMKGVALIIATHLEQNNPNLVLTHWKHILPSLAVFLVEPSSDKASISAWTLLM